MKVYQGSCHCSAVKFEIILEEPTTNNPLELEDCNCSICTKTGFLHLILPLSRFNLKAGKDKLTNYQFNTSTAKHTFCSICGIKPFYTPRSNPNGIDINFNCLDNPPKYITITKFDGQNWEEHAHKLAHKDKD